jgi:hypothetical protein
MSTDLKRCSKRSCNKVVEEDPTIGKKSFSQCAGCREQNRRHQAARRKRSQADAGIESGDENRPPNGAKRVAQANTEGHAQPRRVPFQAIQNHTLGNARNPTTSTSVTSPDFDGNEALGARKMSPLQVSNLALSYIPFLMDHLGILGFQGHVSGVDITIPESH